MSRITLTLATVLSLAFSQASAQDLNKGMDAYNAGDYATALKEWKPLAEQGNGSAQTNLGYMYTKGNGVLKDYAEAKKWYQLSAEQGYAYAQHNLATMYLKGHGVLKDYAEAIKWWRLAAKQGHYLSQNDLGISYAMGNVVPKDNIKAHMWFNIASANGNETSGMLRDKIANKMTPEAIEKATAMASECMNSNYKKCGR